MPLAKLFLAPFLAAVAAGLVSCAPLGLQPAPKPGNVSHVVLVWLKHKGDAAERAKVIETAKTFPGQIPGIISLSVGEPLPSTRPVVDSSFDVGLVFRFESKAALEAYEKNPIHLKAVKETLAPLAAKLVVHDWTVR
jgi:hypothetical protein